MDPVITLNKSKTYILPYVGEHVSLKFFDRLINTYLFYEGDYGFGILYRFSGKKDFLDYEMFLSKHDLFKTMVDVGNDMVLYVFEYPDELYDTVNLFLKGKYSSLPNKNIIKNFLTRRYGVAPNHKIMHILDRTNIYRTHLEKNLKVKIPLDLDLSDKPDKTSEEFKIIDYGQKTEHNLLPQ